MDFFLPLSTIEISKIMRNLDELMRIFTDDVVLGTFIDVIIDHIVEVKVVVVDISHFSLLFFQIFYIFW